MSTATVAPNGNGHAPAFVDLESFRAWLSAQPLASAVQMQSLLQRQLNLLNRHSLNGATRLALLEALREPIYRAQEGCHSRFSGRPLPLTPPEQAALESALATWKALADGYGMCLEALLEGEAALNGQAALIIERTLSALTDLQADSYRSGHLPKAEHWCSLHRLLETAESLNVAEEGVKDKLRSPGIAVTPASAYAEAMLLNAAHPLELTARHFTWVSRWARRWAGKIQIVRSEGKTEVAEDSAVPLYVTLGDDSPASHIAFGGNQRVLLTTDLRQSLKKRLHLLSKGEDPAKMQLGEDCAQPACGQILQQTYRYWCKLDEPRRHERHDSETQHTVYCGFENAHQILLGGKAFRAPGQVDVSRLREEREQLATFGAIRDPQTTGSFVATPSEQWTMLDHSATGMRLQRAPGQNQSRLAAGMLLSVQHGPADFLLGAIRWVLLHDNGTLEAGIALIPGKARAVSVGAKSGEPGKVSHARALVLPAVAALKEGSSLVLPVGWFQPGRVVELHDGDSSHLIRLGQALERGRDFDRVTFSDV